MTLCNNIGFGVLAMFAVLASACSQHEPPQAAVQLYFSIADSSLVYIHRSIEQAGEFDLMPDEGKQYVPATLELNGSEFPAKIKLKGDLIDHWGGERWTFKCKLLNDSSLFGLQSFTLQDPFTRNYLEEWVFHCMLREAEIMALDYRFVLVDINGEKRGCYALEQHFDDDVFATNHRDTSVVLRFNEDEWEPVMLANIGEERSIEIFNRAPVEPHNKKAVKADSARWAGYLRGKELLYQWREGTISTTEAFDAEKMARFWAISTLLNAMHANCWNNRRFYYNVQNDKLEPIGYDANPSGLLDPEHPEFIGMRFFNARMFFRDTFFVERYVKELEPLLAPSFLDRFFTNHADSIATMTELIRVNKSDYEWNADRLYQNQETLRKHIARLRQEWLQ